MNSAIEILDLNYSVKNHWTYKKSQIISNININVLEGESFGFLGHNGAGKTTTIKCMLNLLKPESGCVKFFGKSSLETFARRDVGFLPEQPYFYDHLKVGELIEMYANLKGIKKSEIRGETDRVLNDLNIISKKNFKMRTLSKGQTQRVGMAQAILGKPKILILDEPFSGLDPIGRREFSDLLYKLKKEGVTIFISSHILKDIEFLCDRVSIMSGGKICGVYSIKDLPSLLPGHYEIAMKNFSSQKNELIKNATEYKDHGLVLTLNFKTKEDAENALKIAINSNVTIEEYRFINGGLEELFMSLVNKGAGNE